MALATLVMVVAWAVLHETESCSPTSHTPRGRGRGRDRFRGPSQEGPATSNSAPRRDRAKGRSETTSPRDPNRRGVDHAVGQVVRPHVSRGARGSRDVAIAWSSRRHPYCLGVCRRSLARLTAGAPDAAKNAAAGGHSPTEPSFPSGHALQTGAVAWATAYVLVREGLASPARAVPVAVVFPAVSGLAKLCLDRHWFTDVLAGYLLGGAIAASSAAAYELARPRRRPRLSHAILRLAR